jgi:hypothetical protein
MRERTAKNVERRPKISFFFTDKYSYFSVQAAARSYSTAVASDYEIRKKDACHILSTSTLFWNLDKTDMQ